VRQSFGSVSDGPAAHEQQRKAVTPAVEAAGSFARLLNDLTVTLILPSAERKLGGRAEALTPHSSAGSGLRRRSGGNSRTNGRWFVRIRRRTSVNSTGGGGKGKYVRWRFDSLRR
jgi:hypothetical protein